MNLFRLVPSEFSEDAWRQEIQMVCDAVLARAKPVATVLFGSSLSMERTAESDIDLAIVFQTSEQLEVEREQILRDLPFGEIPVDFLFLTREDFTNSYQKSPIVDVLAKDGELLFGEIPLQGLK